MLPQGQEEHGADSKSADPGKHARVKQGRAWVEYIVGIKVNRPKQLPQILPHECDRRKEGLVRGQIRKFRLGSEGTQEMSAQQDIGNSQQPKHAVAGELLRSRRFAPVVPIKVLVKRG